MQLKAEVQKTFSCCGFDDKIHAINDSMGHPECLKDVRCILFYLYTLLITCLYGYIVYLSNNTSLR